MFARLRAFVPLSVFFLVTHASRDTSRDTIGNATRYTMGTPQAWA
jgi:hypothetical protein